MTTETDLPELVGTLANLPLHTQETIRAYGAACARTALQSPEVQAMKKDADRWRKASESWKVFRVELYPGAVMGHVNGIPWYTLADQADAAMEKQP